MFHLAMSCLQGRAMSQAFLELVALVGDGAGIQLTPGNLPDDAFAALAGTRSTRRHHGFSPAARKVDVWSADGRCLVDAESVHPPRAGEYAVPEHAALEVMYPGYRLGSGAEVDDAMTRGLRLAVDVSHVFIQLTAGAMTAATWQRLADYDRIAEVHVSANRGAADSHDPIAPSTFGLEWARARLAAGTPVVLESYFHRLGRDERLRQIELVRA